jgi:hypothetical protein
VEALCKHAGRHFHVNADHHTYTYAYAYANATRQQPNTLHHIAAIHRHRIHAQLPCE